MNFIKQCFNEIGIKKLALLFHYTLAIATSLLFFMSCIVCTFIPQTIDITELKEIYKIIMIYCAVIIAYITIICIFDKMQTMNRPDKSFDFIAFYIGFAMFVTLGLIIVCVIFMFMKNMTDIELNMWKVLIGIFGSIFGIEAVGGYVYNIFKKKFENDKPPENNCEPVEFNTEVKND